MKLEIDIDLNADREIEAAAKTAVELARIEDLRLGKDTQGFELVSVARVQAHNRLAKLIPKTGEGHRAKAIALLHDNHNQDGYCWAVIESVVAMYNFTLDELRDGTIEHSKPELHPRQPAETAE
jgi:hypothetical protein